MSRWILLVALGTFAVTAVSWATAAPDASDTTITSDDLELLHNGETTIFTGHVVLTQDNYVVTSRRMVRIKSTGIVDADGKVVGTWVSGKKEKTVVTGDHARYQPALNIMEVWGPHRVDVQLDGEKGHALFHGDRGWVDTLQPGKAKLIGQVTGHVIPAGAS